VLTAFGRCDQSAQQPTFDGGDFGSGKRSFNAVPEQGLKLWERGSVTAKFVWLHPRTTSQDHILIDRLTRVRRAVSYL
jgi:hypothetical protein